MLYSFRSILQFGSHNKLEVNFVKEAVGRSDSLFSFYLSFMNLREALLQEHSKKQTLRIVSYISDDKDRFALLMHLFLGPEYRVTQRAAWAVSCCAENHPELLKGWLKKIVQNLSHPGLHDAVKRNSLRLLQFIPIPKYLQGQLANICFGLLQSTPEPVAIKVFSMSVLGNLCKEEPELKNELKLIIESHLPHGSAGFISRGKKVLKQLERL
jgi:hypothetical protein